MNAVSSQVAMATPSFPISIYKLASQHSTFEFVAPPKFVTQNTELSSDAKLLYGFYISKGGKQGYVEGWSRTRIQSELGFSSLHRVDRAQSELVQHGLVLSLQTGNGDAKIVLLIPHPDMELTEEQITERQVSLPADIIRRLLRHLDFNQTKSQQDDPEPSISDPDQPTALAPAANQLGSALPSVPKAIEIKDHVKEIKKEEGMATPNPPTASVTIKPDLPSSNAELSLNRKNRKRRARSKHSIELCLRFAGEEQERKHSIEDAQMFGEACYWGGRHDHEIDRWLKQRAQSEIGRYQGKASTVHPSIAPAQSTTLSPQALADKQELEEEAQIEKLRTEAFVKLSPEEQEQRTQVKLDELMTSEHRAKYLRMSREKLEEHVIEAVKKELISREVWLQPSQNFRPYPTAVS